MMDARGASGTGTSDRIVLLWRLIKEGINIRSLDRYSKVDEGSI